MPAFFVKCQSVTRRWSCSSVNWHWHFVRNDCKLLRPGNFSIIFIWNYESSSGKSQSNSSFATFPDSKHLAEDVLTTRLLSLSQQKIHQATDVSLLAFASVNTEWCAEWNPLSKCWFIDCQVVQKHRIYCRKSAKNSQQNAFHVSLNKSIKTGAGKICRNWRGLRFFHSA